MNRDFPLKYFRVSRAAKGLPPGPRKSRVKRISSVEGMNRRHTRSRPRAEGRGKGETHISNQQTAYSYVNESNQTVQALCARKAHRLHPQRSICASKAGELRRGRPRAIAQTTRFASFEARARPRMSQPSSLLSHGDRLSHDNPSSIV